MIDLRDRLNYFEKYLRIKVKAKGLKPFIPNTAQLKILHIVERLEASGMPIRLVILKARQLGISTLIGATDYWSSS